MNLFSFHGGILVNVPCVGLLNAITADVNSVCKTVAFIGLKLFQNETNDLSCF